VGRGARWQWLTMGAIRDDSLMPAAPITRSYILIQVVQVTGTANMAMVYVILRLKGDTDIREVRSGREEIIIRFRGGYITS